MKKLYEESDIQNIANAIRQKNGSEEAYKVSEMPYAIQNIRGSGGNPKPLISPFPGKVYNDPSGYSPVVATAPSFLPVANHTDENGIWHCPEDWDDVETIQIPDETTQVLYLVYRTDVEDPFIYYKVGQNYKYTKGHVVDGQFIAISETVNKTSSQYIIEILEDDYETSGKHTVVYKLEPQSQTVSFGTTTASSGTIDDKYYYVLSQPLVIRYGQLPKATAATVGATRFLQCDNILNCKKMGSMNGYASTCCSLQKFRHTGWDFSNITSWANAFNQCYQLSDCDMDFTNAVTSKCTNISSMFAYCWALKGDLIVNGWNLSSVTTMAGTFRECFNINAIIGIEDFNLVKCTNLSNTFYNCRSMTQNEQRSFNISNWFVTQTSPVTTTEGMFRECRLLKSISIRGINISTATTVTYMFDSCRSAEEIDIRDISPPSSGALTNVSYMFNLCNSLKRVLYSGDGILSGFDLTKVTTFYNFMGYALSINEIILGEPLKPNNASSSTTGATNVTSWAANCYKVDLGAINAGVITASNNDPIANCSSVVQFYPSQNYQKNTTFANATKLSVASAIRIMESLKPVTTATTLTLPTQVSNRLTDGQKSIATQKGWTVV